MHDDDTTERVQGRPGPSSAVVALDAVPGEPGGVWCDLDEARRALAAQPSADVVVVLAGEVRVNAVLDRLAGEEAPPTAELVADASPVTDAVKRVAGGLVVATVERAPLRRVQPPAVVARAVVERAVAAAATFEPAGEPDAASVDTRRIDLVAHATTFGALGAPPGATARAVRHAGPRSITLGPRELVVFDNDGVLVDSEPISLSVLRDLLDERGWALPLDDVARRFMGGSLTRAATIAAEHGATIEPGFADAFHAVLFARYERELCPVPGVVDVLDELDRRGVPYCVASSGSRERVERSLTRTGLRARFGDRVVTADDVARGKPDPAIFLRSARVQGADPARCLVVEDSALGIEAARRAGMRAVGVSTLTAPADLVDASEGVVRSMAELLAALAER